MMEESLTKKSQSKANKKFALEIAIFSFVIAIVLLAGQKPYPFLFFFIGGLFLFTLLLPQCITPIRIAFEYLTGKMAMINSILILLLVYFLIITPIAFLFRLVGKDLLNLKITGEQSYWKQPGENHSMYHQY